MGRKNTKNKNHNRRKDALLKSAAAAGAVLGGTAMYAQGNAVYGATAQSESASGQMMESVLEQTNASESRVESLSDTESQTAASQEESTSTSESLSIQPDSASESVQNGSSADTGSGRMVYRQKVSSAAGQEGSAQASAVQSDRTADSVSLSNSEADATSSQKASDSTRASEESSQKSSESARQSEAFSGAESAAVSTSAAESGKGSSLSSQSLSAVNSNQDEKDKESLSAAGSQLSSVSMSVSRGSQAASESDSLSAAASQQESGSRSLSAETSTEASAEESQSAHASASDSASASTSNVMLNGSVSEEASAAASESLEASAETSAIVSESMQGSMQLSRNASESVSASGSTSESMSASAVSSDSASESLSSKTSLSQSQSGSLSRASSESTSVSASTSASASTAAGTEKVTEVKVFEAKENQIKGGTLTDLTGTLNLETGVIKWTAHYTAADRNMYHYEWQKSEWWGWEQVRVENSEQYFGLYLNVIAGAENPENITVTDATGNVYTLSHGLRNNSDSFYREQNAPDGSTKKTSLGSNIQTIDYTGRYWGESYTTTQRINVSSAVTVSFDTKMGDYQNWGKSIANVAVSIQATSTVSCDEERGVHPTVGESTTAEGNNRGVITVTYTGSYTDEARGVSELTSMSQSTQDSLS